MTWRRIGQGKYASLDFNVASAALKSHESRLTECSKPRTNLKSHQCETGIQDRSGTPDENCA
jgi:hypothetical protein